jgi:hypothetical protein
VRSDSAKFFGYFLPKKVTTRTNTALCLRHGMGRDAPVFGWRAGRESRATPVTPKALHRTGSGQRPDPPTRQSRSVIPERDSSLPEPHGCRGPLHDANPRRQKNLRLAESAAVCEGKLQSKRLGFGAKCKKPSRLRSLLTHRNLWHAGWRLKRAFRFRKVLWLLSSKESNNKKKPLLKHCTLFPSRYGP